MVCEICRDEAFLAQKAEPAAAEDLGTARDLLDTLIAHKDGCVGMAANMIGVNKRIIAFDNEGEYTVMLNPVIIKESGAYEAEEGCLSLTGMRKAKRFKSIKVQWQNEKLQPRIKTFTGWTRRFGQGTCPISLLRRKGEKQAQKNPSASGQGGAGGYAHRRRISRAIVFSMISEICMLSSSQLKLHLDVRYPVLQKLI